MRGCRFNQSWCRGPYARLLSQVCASCAALTSSKRGLHKSPPRIKLDADVDRVVKALSKAGFKTSVLMKGNK